MSKFQLTYASCCEFVTALGYPVDAERDALNVLCLEGTQPLPELPGLIQVVSNTPDRYNDCVVLFGRDCDGGWVSALRATTQPGWFYTHHPLNPNGAAHLVWGHHLYRRGKHRGAQALVSASGLDRVWRDRDGDAIQDRDEPVHTGRFGIHLHAGGRGQSVGRWSAGCIAVWGGFEGEPYQSLMARVSAHPGKLFNLVLWGGKDARRWLANKSSWQPTLRRGIRGPWVARLQSVLNSRLDSSLVVDGDWGPLTQGAFISFQQHSNLTPDGICGVLSWKALEQPVTDHQANVIHPGQDDSGFEHDIL